MWSVSQSRRRFRCPGRGGDGCDLDQDALLNVFSAGLSSARGTRSVITGHHHRGPCRVPHPAPPWTPSFSFSASTKD
ncbi:unnamed protein product [Urochloa humidicola]